MFSAARHRRFVVLVASLATLSGSSPEVARPATLSQNQEAPQQPPLRPAPGKQISRPPMRFVLPRRVYACADGVQVVVFLETNAVRLTLNEQVYNLKQVDPANSTKYSNGTVVWTTDNTNETGRLEDDSDSAKVKVLAKDCELEVTYPPVGSAGGVVSGTVSFPEHVSLPEGAFLVVELQDVTIADAPATTIAKLRMSVGGRQVPLPFRLTFDPAKIDAKHTYGVEARIEGGGRLLFTNDTLYPALTQGHPARLDLLLKAVDSSIPASQPPN